MRYTIIFLFVVIGFSSFAQEDEKSAFDLVMEQYNAEFTAAETPEEQEAVNQKYESIINDAEAQAESDLQDEIQAAEESLAAEENAFNTQLQADEEAQQAQLFEEALTSFKNYLQEYEFVSKEDDLKQYKRDRRAIRLSYDIELILAVGDELELNMNSEDLPFKNVEKLMDYYIGQQ